MTRSGRTSRRGLTLIELLMSLIVVTILMVGMGAAMTMAARSLEGSTGPAAQTSDAAAVATQINAELRLALDFNELTTGSVGFTVPDRDQPPDGQPETIRYAWSGTPGDPLTRSYNGAPAVDVALDVCEFVMHTSTRSVPGAAPSLTPDPDAWGYFTDGAAAGCDVLFVSGGATAKDPVTGETIVTPTAQEDLRISLLETWGHAVTVVAQAEDQAYYDAAAADNDVAYVSEQVDAFTLGSKLSNTTIGVVSEKIDLCGAFGFAQTPLPKTLDTIEIIDDTHAITSGLPLGTLTIVSTSQPVHMLSGQTAAGLGVLAESRNTGSIYLPSLAVLETGDTLYPSGTAAARRVQLPWGDVGFDFAALNGDGRTIMKRSIEWAAGAGADPPPPPQAILLVVVDAAAPSAEETFRRDLIESKGFVIELIGAAQPKADFDAAIARNDAAYVSNSISDNDLGTKLVATSIGVVNEDQGLFDEFGFAERAWSSNNQTDVAVVDASHYITSTLGMPSPVIFSPAQTIVEVDGQFPVSPDLQLLAQKSSGSGNPVLMALSPGAMTFDGGTVAGRRVQVPWGLAHDALTTDGETLMQRSIEWAAGSGDVAPTLTVLFVVGDPAALDSKESGRRTLMESWNFSVTLIDDSDPQADFDTALALCEAVYLADSVTSSALGGKVHDTALGIVNENDLLIDDVGFAAGSDGYGASQLAVFDPAHYVSSTLVLDPTVVFTTSLTMRVPSSSMPAPDLMSLLEHEQAGPDIPAVVAIDMGGRLSDAVGGTAAGRRIHLPFGSAETSQLTTDGQTVMRRAIEWAAGEGAGSSPTEQLLAAHDDDPGGYMSNNGVSNGSWISIHFSPTLPAGTTSWSVTRVLLRARNAGGANGVSKVQLRTVDGTGQPTATILEEVTLLESNLTSSFEWVEFPYAAVEGLDPAQDLCIVVAYESGNATVARLQYEGGIPDAPDSAWSLSLDSGASWQLQPDEMRFQVYGTATN